MAGKRASRCGLNDTMARWGSRRVDGVLLTVNVIFQRASWGCVFVWLSWSDERGVGPCSRASSGPGWVRGDVAELLAALNAAASNGMAW